MIDGTRDLRYYIAARVFLWFLFFGLGFTLDIYGVVLFFQQHLTVSATYLASGALLMVVGEVVRRRTRSEVRQYMAARGLSGDLQ